MASANDDPIVTCIERTLELIAHGEVAAARDVLQTLDQGYVKDLRCARLKAAAGVKRVTSLPVAQRTKRGSLTYKIKTATFEHDQYTCRFCGTRTIDLEVLKALSRIFPAELPYDSAWKHGRSSLVYWTHSTSLEHVIPIARGGLDRPDNYATTCYACNDARGDLLLVEIGWRKRPASREPWDGLRRYLPTLRRLPWGRAVDPDETGSGETASPHASSAHRSAGARQASEIRVGMFVRATPMGQRLPRKYRVEHIAPEHVVLLREMWTSNGLWVESKRQVQAELAAVLAVLAEVAPRPGDACEQS